MVGERATLPTGQQNLVQHRCVRITQSVTQIRSALQGTVTLQVIITGVEIDRLLLHLQSLSQEQLFTFLRPHLHHHPHHRPARATAIMDPGMKVCVEALGWMCVAPTATAVTKKKRVLYRPNFLTLS